MGRRKSVVSLMLAGCLAAACSRQTLPEAVEKTRRVDEAAIATVRALLREVQRSGRDIRCRFIQFPSERMRRECLPALEREGGPPFVPYEDLDRCAEGLVLKGVATPVGAVTGTVVRDGTLLVRIVDAAGAETCALPEPYMFGGVLVRITSIQLPSPQSAVVMGETMYHALAAKWYRLEFRLGEAGWVPVSVELCRLS
jgi:hypothetical protein